MKKLTYSNALLLHRVLVGLADSAIKIFIPLLIYKQTQNIFLSFLFGIVDFALTALFFGVLKKLIQKQPVLCIGFYVVLIIAVQFLLLVELNIYTILSLAVLSSLATTLYYGSINLLFGIMDKNTNTAKFETGQQIGKIIFSIISIYLIGNVANSLTFIIIFSSVLYLLSIWPLLTNRKELKLKLAEIKNVNAKIILLDKKTHKFNIFHIFTGIFSVFTEFILPLYLYISGLSYTVVGLLVVLQCVVRILGNFTGKFINKKNWLKIITIVSAVVLFGCLLSIMLVKIDYVIYILTLVITLFYQILFTSYFDLFIKDQKAKGYFQDSIFYRDVYQNVARVAVIGIYMLSQSFVLMFVFAMISSGGIGASGFVCLNKKDGN